MISGHSYSRRCRACRHTETFGLPDLKKTVIYLDQFVVSNIAKVLDPEFPRRDRLMSKQPFWLDLYKKLDRLLKLQLIVCPDSHFHRSESLLSDGLSFDVLQDVYSHLSNDCTFKDDSSILNWQVQHHFADYLEGRPEREPNFPVEEIVTGDLHEWQDRIRVTVPFRSLPDEVESGRATKQQLHGFLVEVFKRWQQDRSSFEECLQEEAASYAQGILKSFLSYHERLRRCRLGLEVPESPLELLPPPAAVLVRVLCGIAEGHGTHDPAEQLQTVFDYFRSPHILRIPCIRLTAMLYAAMARRAQAGKKKPPNQGTITDVQVIASLLPHCDAMFVDREMAGYLRETPLNEEVQRFGTRIFSLGSRDDFFGYLDELETKASRLHLSLVEEVYGTDWPTPFTSLIEQRRASRERVGLS